MISSEHFEVEKKIKPKSELMQTIAQGHIKFHSFPVPTITRRVLLGSVKMFSSFKNNF